MIESRVILCPGQGAQSVGMGQRWLESSALVNSLFDRAASVLGTRFERDLRRICLEGPETFLNRTDVAQPALYTLGVASFRAIWGEGDVLPAATAGLSLGEYTALHLAGAFSFEDGLKLVALRGLAMQQAAEASPGSMVALIGADEAQAHEVCAAAAGGEVLSPANYNAPGQIVLSGSLGACARAVEKAGAMGLRASPLAVAGAFHSMLMSPAADRLGEALRSVEILPPRCPAWSNVTAEPHEASADSIRRRLVEQLTRPVLWSQTCVALTKLPSPTFHELAPGKVLAGLMRRIDRAVKVLTHDEPG